MGVVAVSGAAAVMTMLMMIRSLLISLVENVRWCGRRLLDGHAGSAIKVLVAIHYSVLDARNGYIRNVVV